MQIGYLGPLEVRFGDRTVDVPGRRLRTLLGRLATDVGRAVPPRVLIEALWPGDTPGDPANALQSLVSRLRRTLGDPAAVEQLPGGYRLAVEPEGVDAVRFVRLAATGRQQLAAGSSVHAADTLRQALSLWRGEPLPDDDSLEADAVRARLHDVHLQARADRIDADLTARAAGGPRGEVGLDGDPGLAGLVAELEQLVAEHPLREDLASLRMRAFVAVGRPAEALAAYETTRSYLADTLGTDPSPALRDQHLAVLRAQDAGPVTRRTNLRAAVTSFVGRDADAAKVEALLRSGRLVTIVGAGGAGKTRLASEVAAAWLTRVRDGVWFVELAPVGDADNLDIAVLDGVGGRELVTDPLERPERPRMTAHDRVLEVLADADALVVIDNCEHIVDATAELVADILGSCPGVRLLATSREPLGIDGESLYPLTPLGLPAADATAAEAAAAPAVALLVDRARAAGAELTLDDQTVADVVEVVRRLDGLPLAIELAAARLRVMSVAEVATRLGDRFRLLTGGRRTAMPRHRTLRAVVQWSWELLTPLERDIAERFSVFGSGASTAAVAAVCPGATPADVEDSLHALVDKSLLVPVQDHGEARFRMLETLREYGTEQLAEAGTLEQTRAAHAAYFAELVRDSDAGLRGRDQVRWLRRLDADRDNLLAGLAFLGDHGQAQDTLTMAIGLSWFWMLRENGKDAARWLRFALEVPGASETPAAPVAEAMLVVSEFAMADNNGGADDLRGGLVGIAERLESSLAVHPLVALLQPLLYFFSEQRSMANTLTERNLDSDDLWVRAASRTIRVAFRENDGDIDGMRADLERAYVEWQELGDHWGMAQLLSSRGQVRTLDGDHAGAAADFEEAQRHWRLLGSTNDDLLVTMRLADLRLRAGDFEGARRLAEDVRGEVTTAEPANFGDGRAALGDVMLGSIAYILGDEETLETIRGRVLVSVEMQREPSIWYSHLLAVAYGFLAMVAAARGELTDARRFVGESIVHGVRTNDFPILASGGVALASYAHALGADTAAAEVLGASARLRGSDDATATMIARLITSLRESLGDGFDVAYDAGKAMGRDEAIARLDPALLD